MTDHSGDPQQENASDDYLLSVEEMKLPKREKTRQIWQTTLLKSNENAKAQGGIARDTRLFCLWSSIRGTQRGYSSKPLNIALLNVF